MQKVPEHPFFQNSTLDAVMLEDLKKSNEKILEGVNAVRELSEQHRDELRQTRSVLIRAIFDAMEVSTPTAFCCVEGRTPFGGEGSAASYHS